MILNSSSAISWFTLPPSNYRWVVMGLWILSGVSGFMVLSTLGNPPPRHQR